MDWASRLSFLRSRNGLIVLAVVLVVGVSAVVLYLNLTSPPQAATASPTPVPSRPAPSVPEVGAQTVTRADTVEVLAIVSTTPSSGSMNAAADTPIDLRFNLPVDPATAQIYFTVLPAVAGTFSQGPTPQEIVFTPSTSFGLGSSVNVVVRKGYASRDGYALQADFGFTFVTSLSPATVLFQVGDQVARLASAQSGHSVSVNAVFGDGVPPTVTLQTFRASSSALLAAQVHDANGAFLDAPIDTSSMQLVATAEVANGGTYTATEPDGIYLLLALDGPRQFGAIWLDFSRYGVILRQDDQKIVLAGEDLTTGETTPPFNVTFFNLQGGVQAVLTGSFTGTGEFAAAFPTPIDVAVATSAGEEVMIPVLVPQTSADIKVVGDLSSQPRIFLTTDRAGYQKGESVRFAGTVRMSNDQAYTVPVGMTLAVWWGYGANKLVSQTVVVADDGTFSGSFVMPAGAFSTDGSDGQMMLLIGTPDREASDTPQAFAVITTLGDHAPAGSISVVFDKATYVAGDTVVASVSGVDRSGKPLAGESVRLSVYSAGIVALPSELDSFPGPDTWGVPAQNDVTVALDAKGHASYKFRANLAQKAADQEVTLAVTYGSGATAAMGARSAIVLQAADEIFLLPSRTVYAPGDGVIAPFVVETATGQRAANVPVAYEFDRTDYQGDNVTTTVVGSGTVITDANGLGTVRTLYSGPLGDVVLRIKGKDAAGNVFADAMGLTISDNAAQLSWLGPTDTLMQLSLTTDKIAYAVGEDAHLVLTSPATEQVFMALERGRIHQARWVSLLPGENQLTLPITPDLAPGFTVTLSYFREGTYFTEGVPIAVNNSDRLLTVAMAADQASYKAGQTAHVTITITDATGAPVAATLLADGYEASMSAYKLVDQGSLGGAFLTPAVRGTNGSSSLTGIGSWGGRCGGGEGGPVPAVTNPGHTTLWLTGLTTDANGKATIDVPIAQASVRLVVFGATTRTSLGQAQLDLNVP